MPTERCLRCNIEQNHGTPNSIMERNADGNVVDIHHGRSCIFGLCQRHCNCTPTNRRAWRALTPTAARTRTCVQCGTRTAHTCLTFTRSGLQAPHHRLCGVCCTTCRLAIDIPCANRERPEVFTCLRCQYQYNTAQHAAGGLCIFCDAYGSDNTSRCVSCNGYYGLPNDSDARPCQRCRGCLPYDGDEEDEDDEYHGCCRCTRRTRPTLHNCELFRGFMHGKSGERNPLARSVGIEFEVAGFRRPKRRALEELYNTCVEWHAQIGTDGSLRDDTGEGSSVEIRTAPASGDDFVTQVYDITRAIRKANGFVNTSCGMHVHVNARTNGVTGELDEHKLYALCRIWHKVEPLWVAMIEPGRTDGAYCNIWAAQLAQHPSHYLDTYQRYSYHTGRYSTLNLHALEKYGTVEFRLHHGCISPRISVAWAMMCSAFVELCYHAHDHLYVDTLINNPNIVMRSIAITKDIKAYQAYAVERWARKGFRLFKRAA